MRRVTSPNCLKFSVLFCVTWLFLNAVTVRAGENWPQFRGPDSSGVAADGEGLPVKWSQTENVAWKTSVPGLGWSSPVVWGERIFLTTAIKEAGEESEAEPIKKGLYFGGNRETPGELHRWKVYCIDFETGKVRWEKLAHEGIPEHGHHLKNTLASETPLTDGERVYAYFGNIGLFCYDMDGKELWKTNWGSSPVRHNWGTAASPVLHGGRLYIVNDNDEQSFIVAIDKLTGDEVWRVDRDEKSNWATPFIWENSLRTEIVTPATGRVRSYSLEGDLLWELGGMSSIAIPTPFVKFGLLYVSSGYVLDKRKPIFAIRPGASGDISLGDDETSNEYISWCQKRGAPYNTSPIIYGQNFYVLYDQGIFGAFDALDGEKIFKKRIGGGARAFTSSPWAYDGKIFCLSEDGETFVIEAGDEFKLLHSNPLDEFCMATPAIAGNSLIIRTETQLYRIAQESAE